MLTLGEPDQFIDILKHVPDPGGAVIGGGGEALALGVERQGKDRSRVPFEGLEELAGVAVPDPGGAVRGGGGEALALGVERQGTDRSRVPNQRELLGIVKNGPIQSRLSRLEKLTLLLLFIR